MARQRQVMSMSYLLLLLEGAIEQMIVLEGDGLALEALLTEVSNL